MLLILRNFLASLIVVCGLVAGAWAAPDMNYTAVVNRYFQAEWAARPVLATELGLHQGDGRLDDVSQTAHLARTARLHAVLAALRAVAPGPLSVMERDDRDVLMAEIDGQLLGEEAIQPWRHDPDSYVSLASAAVYTLIERDFAPAVERLKSAVAREAAMPEMIGEAKKNLSEVPSVFVDIALEDVEGAIGFIGSDVPAAFAGTGDTALRTRFAASTKAAVSALQDYKSYLVALKPKATGSFLLGPEKLQRLLASDLVTVSAEQVLAAGKAQLARDQTAFQAISRQVDPAQPSAALALIGHDHPDTVGLVPAARNQLASLQSFIRQHDILSLPQNALPVVAETPVFQRAIVFGEMDAPGPFETQAKTAYYYITPPGDKLSAAERETYLAYFNRALLQNLSVHEALPGHFIQYLAAEAHPEWSLVRKSAQSYTATEGWAHYSEQMMLDEGLGGGDPRLRLAQLQDAMLRDCRLIASISMHAHGMSLDAATKMMQTECYQPAVVAYKEARRGTEDPGYFSYTLGKLEILKLRRDLASKEGPAFSLGRFHDRFLAAGLVPIAIIRREIMGKDGAVL